MSHDHGRTMRSETKKQADGTAEFERGVDEGMRCAPNQTRPQPATMDIPKKDESTNHPLWPYFTQWFSMTLMDCEDTKTRKRIASQVNSYWDCFRVSGLIVRKLFQQEMAERENDDTDRTGRATETLGSSPTGTSPTGDSGAE